MQPAHHRPDGDVKGDGRLLVRQASKVDQLDDESKLLGKPVERPLDRGVECAPQDNGLRSVGGGGHRPRRLDVGDHLGPLSPAPVGAGVAQDGQQPGSGVTTVETVDGPVGAQERVLDKILGVGRMAGERPCNPQENLDLGQHLLGECLLARATLDRLLHAQGTRAPLGVFPLVLRPVRPVRAREVACGPSGPDPHGLKFSDGHPSFQDMVPRGSVSGGRALRGESGREATFPPVLVGRRLATASRTFSVAAALLAGTFACGSDARHNVADVPEPAEAPAPRSEPAGRLSRLPGHPEGLVFDAGTSTLIAGVDGGVALLSPDGTLVKVVELGARPRHVALAEHGGAALVPLEGSDELVVVGLPDGEVRQRVRVGRNPHDAAAAAGRVFVGDEFADTISVIGGSVVQATLPGPVQPGGVAVGGSSLAVVGVRGRHLKVLDTTTLGETATLDAGVGPTHVVASGPLGYVSDTQGDAILSYRLGAEPRRVGRTAVPGAPYGLALDGARSRLWVTLTKTNELVEFSLTGEQLSRRATYPTVRQPNSVAVDPRTGTVYVVGATAGQLQIVTPEP